MQGGLSGLWTLQEGFWVQIGCGLRGSWPLIGWGVQQGILDADWVKGAVGAWEILGDNWLGNAVCLWGSLNPDWVRNATGPHGILGADWLGSAHVKS